MVNHHELYFVSIWFDVEKSIKSTKSPFVILSKRALHTPFPCTKDLSKVSASVGFPLKDICIFCIFCISCDHVSYKMTKMFGFADARDSFEKWSLVNIEKDKNLMGYRCVFLFEPPQKYVQRKR